MNASAQLEKKAKKKWLKKMKLQHYVAVDHNWISTKRKDKVNDLRVYHDIEATFEKVKREYLYYEN